MSETTVSTVILYNNKTANTLDPIFGGLDDESRQQLDEVRKANATELVLASSAWVEDTTNNVYTLTLTNSKYEEKNKAMLDICHSDPYDDDKCEEEDAAWALIRDIVEHDGTLVFIAIDQPETDITVSYALAGVLNG